MIVLHFIFLGTFEENKIEGKCMFCSFVFMKSLSYEWYDWCDVLCTAYSTYITFKRVRCLTFTSFLFRRINQTNVLPNCVFWSLKLRFYLLMVHNLSSKSLSFCCIRILCRKKLYWKSDTLQRELLKILKNAMLWLESIWIN